MPKVKSRVHVIAALLAVLGVGAIAHASDQSNADLQSRVSRLAAEVQAAEDVRAIKRL
jgi:hypothetical protein